MVAWTFDGPRGLGAFLVAVALGSVVVACATSPDDPRSASTDSTSEVLTDIWVEREGEASLVTLVGLEDPVYTAALREDPAALVVDISGGEVGGPSEPLVVYDGLIEQVSVSSFEDGAAGATTRVEITLSEPAAYDVEATSVGLSLRLESEQAFLGRDGDAAQDDFADGGDPWADPGMSAVDEEPIGEDDTYEVSAPASQLASIDVRQTSDGVLLHLVADGSIGAASSFTLENPDRLVIDLPEIENAVKAAKVAVDLPHVARVRIGAHPDKVRVVIDGGASADGFEGRRVIPAANGLFVTLGQGDDLEQALALSLAASEPTEVAAIEQGDFEDPMLGEPASEPEFEAEDGSYAELTEFGSDEVAYAESDATTEAFDPGPSSSTAVVHGVHFDSQPERDRIVVLSERVVEFETHTPDPETVVLSILRADIPREAEGRITPQPGGPVSLVTAFQQPDVSEPEVRIVVKRASGLEPEVTRRGGILFLDFPNTGVAAAAPPAFPGTQQVLSTGGTASEADASDAGSDMARFETVEGTLDDAADVDGLPEFSEPASIDGAGGFAPEPVSPAAPLAGAGAPASLEPPAAVDLLREGGLIDGKEYKGRRISLDFKDVEIADVLRIIAEVSDLNIVAGEEVTGTVTIRLVDVPWDQALDVILLTKGLGFVRVGNVLRIAPGDILQQEEELRLTERRNKEKLEDLAVKLHPVNYADVEEVSNLVKRLLSARGTVQIDTRTNTLIIKDIASVIDEATALVNAVDTQTPQVMIEAKIVEANLDFSRELGAAWSIGTQPATDGFDPSTPRRDLGGEDFKFHDENSVVFANPITSLANGLATMNAFLLDEQLDVSVQIAAAESTGNGKVISSPRIVTLDNREAEISQGVSIPFQTFENGDAKLEFVDAVLKLIVTPHITADKSIIMKVEVQRNAPDDSVDTPTGSPAIAKNEAKTETLVKDGQTLVIGGIYTITKTERQSRVPYLWKLPIVGNAFRNNSVTDARKELLIFVTPRIVLQPAA